MNCGYSDKDNWQTFSQNQMKPAPLSEATGRKCHQWQDSKFSSETRILETCMCCRDSLAPQYVGFSNKIPGSINNYTSSVTAWKDGITWRTNAFKPEVASRDDNPSIPALGSQRQGDLEFKTSMGYIGIPF